MVSRIDDKQQQLKKLLPWYVNGTLAAEERMQVKEYVAADPNGQAEVDFLKSVQTAIREQQEDVVSPAEFGWQRLQRTIPEQRHESNTESTNRWWRPTLAAAAILLMIQGGVLLQIWPVYQQHYTVLSSHPQSTGGTVLQISFEPNITEQRLREIINKVDARIIGGPGSLGIYRLQLPENIKQPAEVGLLIEKLRNTPGIAVVEFD